MLYQLVLADDDEEAEGGVTDIERTIIEMNDRACKALEEFEKTRKKKGSLEFQPKSTVPRETISPDKRKNSISVDDRQSPRERNSTTPEMIASSSQGGSD